ncbi:hypothetical protein Arub01_04720 [Actinomadura rubrobrunea]|uniref:Flavin reductase like domain-containing protein n=1 Tax=Actinomadura rubrobrunea TaxID=115335 RepID=A0A9W6PSL6_9ACTN|nr:flavin reductase family protein [Actinomadura rubrobrunea]GLW62228.1 hypothetical protein Arub01_04720 [Actinomadura rubrobrunea]
MNTDPSAQRPDPDVAPAGAAPDVAPLRFRQVMGRFATGVAVVTTVADGVDHGMTVNAFTSVSLEPPLVLFCVDRTARFHDMVLDSGLWAVSVLTEGMRDVSRWFATRGHRVDGRLRAWGHRRGAATGAVIFTGAVAALECRTYAVHDGGDHSIVVGEVLDLDTPDPSGKPLLYYEGEYRGISWA